VKLLTNKLTKL